MRSTRRIVLAALAGTSVALLLVVAPARAQAPTSTDKVAAEALFEEGRRLVAAGSFVDACPKFADSQRLDPSPGTLLNLASCYEKLGRSATAWATVDSPVIVATVEPLAARRFEIRTTVLPLGPVTCPVP